MVADFLFCDINSVGFCDMSFTRAIPSVRYVCFANEGFISHRVAGKATYRIVRYIVFDKIKYIASVQQIYRLTTLSLCENITQT